MIKPESKQKCGQYQTLILYQEEHDLLSRDDCSASKNEIRIVFNISRSNEINLILDWLLQTAVFVYKKSKIDASLFIMD
jgi:hypothetical protein